MAEKEAKCTAYKEIFIRRQPDDWNEITLNTGGVSSTLQDFKPQQRSGAFAYKNLKNRFISWRTEGNVLEITEHSLDVNLQGNQVRYVFTDSQILEGISLNETSSNLILLVPTASSVHRFQFTHPNKLSANNFGEPSALSIFYGANENVSMDPRTYYNLTPPCAIITAASCLLNFNVAVFALSLANSSIMIVHMDLQKEATKVMNFREESLMPRLIFGLADAIMKKDSTENVAVSLLFHEMLNELILFSLDKQGRLKAWLCQRGSTLATFNLISKELMAVIKNQNHRMFSGVYNNEFVLHCCIQGQHITTVMPNVGNSSFSFVELCKTKMPNNAELVSLCASHEQSIWCNWLSDVPLVSKVDLGSGQRIEANVHFSRPHTEIKSSRCFVKDQSVLYIDGIFNSGYFTAYDVMKALSIYKPTAVIKPNVNIREQICAVVEAEIYSEIGEQDIYDDEFQDLSLRCWERLYSCCTQYVHNAMLPLSLIKVGNVPIIIHASGFSLIAPMDDLELLWRNPSFESCEEINYSPLIEILHKMDIDESSEMIDVRMLTGEPMDESFQNFKLVTSQRFRSELENISELFSSEEIHNYFTELIYDMKFPENFIKDDEDEEFEDDWKAFCSHSGLSAVTFGMREYCLVRLEVCKKLLFLLELLDFNSTDHIVKEVIVKYKSSIEKFYKVYNALSWVAMTNINVDTPIILSYISAHYRKLMSPTFDVSVFTLINALWPHEDNKALVEHLLSNKHYLLVETYSRLVNHDSWKLLVVEAYLGMGEFYKAYDKCMLSNSTEIKYYLKCIRLFENNQRSDIVVKLARNARKLCSDQLNPSDFEMIQSILFIHELKLNHFLMAYKCMEHLNDMSKKVAFLQRLVLAMINSGRLKDLIQFNFISVARELDTILSKRAKNSDFSTAETYYNLLCAIHIKNENYKRAASIMYEKGCRSDSNEMQWRCFGACFNAMMLLKPEDSWILKPNLTFVNSEASVQVLSIEDVRREYELAGAKYSLGDCPLSMKDDEVISSCMTKRQYKIALRIANICKQSFTPIIKTFTAECLNLSNDWPWLKMNELDDIQVNEDNYSDACWDILKRFITRYEKTKESELHKAVLSQILDNGAFVPQWLYTSYCQRNTAEFLRMLINGGRLDDAAQLAADYLNAAAGISWKSYNIDSPVLPHGPPVYLPIHLIDVLLVELKNHKVPNTLEAALDEYLKLANRISSDKIALALH